MLAKLSTLHKPACGVCASEKFEVGQFCGSVPLHFDEVALELLGNVASYDNVGGAVSLVVTKTMHMDNEKLPKKIFFRKFTGIFGLGG